jgi:F-type H+-transporting ATPase subunit delta
MEEIAQVYSRSLFEVAKEQGKLDDIREQLGEFADALDASRELQVFFFSPYFSTEEKKDGLARAVTQADEILINFLGLLLDKHRMPVVFRIRRQLDERWEEENAMLRVEVTSAVELDDSVVRQIGNRVGEQTDRKVELASRVDPDILGGIVLRVGNSILDASIRNRLDQLRREVAKAT